MLFIVKLMTAVMKIMLLCKYGKAYYYTYSNTLCMCNEQRQKDDRVPLNNLSIYENM